MWTKREHVLKSQPQHLVGISSVNRPSFSKSFRARYKIRVKQCLVNECGEAKEEAKQESRQEDQQCSKDRPLLIA